MTTSRERGRLDYVTFGTKQDWENTKKKYFPSLVFYCFNFRTIDQRHSG